jgi:hypothetical protein
MKTIRIYVAVLTAMVALALATSADERQAAKKGSKNPAFEKIKALSGEWQVTGGGPDEHAAHAGTISYKVTAGGSAVLETLFAGTPHEMVTLYYMDGDHLALTHYCMLHNRPHMRAERQSNADKIVFKCREGDRIEAEDHMHQATFTFVDADHLKTEWVLYKDGKPDSAHSFELTRKKK